jgi:N-methylhydantoinase A
LQVGPHSAGADPGPVCYDKGGTEPTVTDANVLLGILHPDHLLGGKVKLNREKAAQAIANLGARLGLDPLHTAEGIVRIINAHMVEGIRTAAAERGYDITEFALVAFGGAGPVHAGTVAAELGMRKVIVPPMPGLTSALGLLLADLRRDYVRSRLRRLDQVEAAEINSIFAELREQALREITADGFPESQVRLSYAMDLRYLRQGYELTVPVGTTGKFVPADIQAVRRRFDDYHEELFGHTNRTEPVEAVNYRARADVVVPKATLKRYRKTRRSPEAARTGQRQVCFDSRAGMISCPIYDRSLLGPGHTIPGPAIVEQFDSTTVVYPGQTAQVDNYQNLVLTLR